MLNSISGGEFTRTLLLVAALYYGLILVNYYRKEIKKRLTNKRSDKLDDKV